MGNIACGLRINHWELIHHSCSFIAEMIVLPQGIPNLYTTLYVNGAGTGVIGNIEFLGYYTPHGQVISVWDWSRTKKLGGNDDPYTKLFDIDKLGDFKGQHLGVLGDFDVIKYRNSSVLIKVDNDIESWLNSIDLWDFKKKIFINVYGHIYECKIGANVRDKWDNALQPWIESFWDKNKGKVSVPKIGFLSCQLIVDGKNQRLDSITTNWTNPEKWTEILVKPNRFIVSL